MAPQLPQRIMVTGPSGSGKSTLARLIGDKLGLPVVHLDAVYWRPGWIEPTVAEFRDQVAALVRAERWVMDGSYSSTLDLRLPRLDVIVYLDLPRRVYFPRVLWRTLRHYGRQRPDLAEGCREQFDPKFLFGYVWGYPKRRPRTAARMADLAHRLPVITLRSRREVAHFTAGLPGSLARQGVVSPPP